MLKSHMDAKEAVLLANARIPANAGHPLHMGTPRESFIQSFLKDHLSEKVAISTGEVIDANSRPGQRRNQHDIVVYKREFPKLDFGGGITGFLAESVVATIEVKSTLNQAEYQSASLAARNVKALNRTNRGGIFQGYQPPSILSFLVAYDGPARMNTVHGWHAPFATAQGIVNPQMGNTLNARTGVIAPCLDGIFVLGKGFMTYDNCPVSLLTDATRGAAPNTRWTVSNSQDGNLLMLFLILTNAISGLAATSFNAVPYVQHVRWVATPHP